MSKVREPAVSGMFYPATQSTVQSQLEECFGAANDATVSSSPKALIVPHAGWVYSGSTAASAYKLLAAYGDTIKRVVVLGPAHRVWVPGLAMSSADVWRTPLGDVPIDYPAELRVLRQVETNDGAHDAEHSLEVQLPFLQRMLGDFVLTPLVVGGASADEVAQALHAVWGGPETLIVISTDLSHYLPYDEAKAVDQQTIEHILALSPDITPEQACGARPLNGMLYATREREMEIALLAACNSGDTAGDKDRVVGYASFVVTAGELHE